MMMMMMMMNISQNYLHKNYLYCVLSGAYSTAITRIAAFFLFPKTMESMLFLATTIIHRQIIHANFYAI